MTYLTYFLLPSDDMEVDFIWSIKQTCYDSHYPFKVLSVKGLRQIEFEPLTILYGGNGSGKSTALNVIAEKIKVKRDSIFNKSNFYPNYIDMCEAHISESIPENSRIITSDDVFDYMLNIRSLNDRIDQKREDIFKEYMDAKYSQLQFKSIEDYDKLKKINKSRGKTRSQYVRDELIDNVIEYSNGESAFKYFTDRIEENGLYLLDEPENSLSPKRQMELMSFIENHVRFFRCQFIISTHSPFLLSMYGAKIYVLDENPVTIKKWTELENVRIYHEFFKLHDKEF